MIEEQIKQEPEQIGPGQILREGREKAGLSQRDIASKLHLRESGIADLEQDIYKEDVSLTFTKGYLKLYAREVNVSEEEVLCAFAALNQVKKEPAKLKTFSRRVAKQASDDRLMLVTYLIIAVVIALVVIWWLQQEDTESTSSVPSTVSPSAIVDPDKAPQAPQAAEPLTQAPAESAEDSATAQAVQEITEASNVQEAALEAAEQSAMQQQELELPQPLPAVAQSPAIAQSQTVVTSEQNPSPADAADKQLADVAAQQTFTDTPVFSDPDSAAVEPELMRYADPVELVFEFSNDCWMNLVDATGEAIAFGIKKSGRVMPVSGIPPFEVTLGKPQYVSISYAGETVDMSQFDGTRTAKFNLPMQGQ